MLITCNNCGAKVPKERYTYHLKGCKRMSVQNHTSKKPKYGGIQVSQLSAFSFISSANKSLTMPENISHQIRNISGDNNLGFSLDNTEFSVHDEDSSLEEQHNDQEQEEESLEEQIPLLEMQARHLKSLMITNAEHVSLEFYNLLESLGVSKSAYDKIIKFISENNMKDLSNMLCYKSLLSNMEKRSGNDLSLTRPKQKLVYLPATQTHCQMTIFNFQQQLMSLLTNERLMAAQNLIIGPPSNEEQHQYYGEINTSDWYNKTKEELCKEPNDLLVPIILFIDETTIDNAGGLHLEPVKFTLGIFNTQTRSSSEAWKYLGFIPKLENFQLHGVPSSDVGRMRLKDYHLCLSYILEGLYSAQNSLIQWNFNGTVCNLKFPIMFVIGDTKGQDKLVGRYANWTNSEGIVKDCYCSRENADVLNQECRLIKSLEIQELIEADRRIQIQNDGNDEFQQQLKRISFYKDIDNAFSRMSFGANQFGINGACPPCLLHVFQLKFPCVVVKGFINLLGESDNTLGKQALNRCMNHIISFSQHQSERGFPDITTYKDKIDHLKSYSAEEKYARVFALYLFSLTDISINLIEQNMPALKKRDNAPTRHQFQSILASYRKLLEETLTIYQWLYKEEHKKVHIKPIQRASLQTLAHEPINNYLSLFKSVLNDQHGGYSEGISCKFPKFHLIQHFPLYIARYGSAKNYNGGPCERNHKGTKKHARRTQRNHSTLSYQTATNHTNHDILSQTLQSYNLQFVDDNDEDLNSSDGEEGNVMKSSKSTRYEIFYESLTKKCILKWEKRHGQPGRAYDDDMLATVAHKLWEDRMVNLPTNISIPCFTELHYKGMLFRAHPDYRSSLNPWFDWANFKWEGIDHDVPGRIFMFLDLRNVPDNPLGNDIFVVIQSALSIAQNLQNNRAKDLKLCTFWTMEDKYRIISVDCISSPTYVMNNFDNTRHIDANDDMRLLKTVIQIKSFSEWKNVYL